MSSLLLSFKSKIPLFVILLIFILTIFLSARPPVEVQLQICEENEPIVVDELQKLQEFQETQEQLLFFKRLQRLQKYQGLRYNEPRRRIIPCPRASSGKMVIVTKIHGGLADRLKGMVNAYILALLSGRGFYYEQALLVDSANTTDPGACFWSEPSNYQELPGDVWQVKEINRHKKRFSEVDFASHESSSVWSVHSNVHFGDDLIDNKQFLSSPHQPELFKSHQEGKLFHQAIRSLLVPSESMAAMMDQELNKRNPNGTHFLIGIHIRAGDEKMGARRKRDDSRMVPDEAIPCFAQEALVAWNELSVEEQSIYSDGPLYYISSDYPTGARVLKNRLHELGHQVFDADHLAGGVKHIGWGEEQSRTFVDWWFLTKSQKMVITVSGFSETASKYDCVPVSFFVNYPTLNHHNDFSPEACVHHFIRMRGDGLCVREMDDNPIYEYTDSRFKKVGE